jgi:hypothetical protein
VGLRSVAEGPGSTGSTEKIPQCSHVSRPNLPDIFSDLVDIWVELKTMDFGISIGQRVPDKWQGEFSNLLFTKEDSYSAWETSG